MKKRRDYNVKVAFRGFLLVFVFSWKFLTPIQLKLVKRKRGVGTAHCNRGPERYRLVPRIVIEGPSGTEVRPRIVIEGPSGTEAVPRIVI